MPPPVVVVAGAALPGEVVVGAAVVVLVAVVAGWAIGVATVVSPPPVSVDAWPDEVLLLLVPCL